MKTMKFLLMFLILTACALNGLLHAFNYQDWLKWAGQQKGRKISTKQTTIAAVRGVDDPGEVDPNARNYEGVNTMESRAIPPERLAKFESEGKLVRKQINKSSAAEPKKVAP